jgi:hypothetical protein
MFKKLFAVSLGLLLLSVCCVFTLKMATRAKAQEPKRIITETAPIRFPGYVDSPVRINKVTVGDQVAIFGREFTAPDGFLKNLKIELTNDSDKVVTFVSINLKLQIGDTTAKPLPSNGNALLIPYDFGDKSWTKGTPSVEPSPFLKPGQSVTVSLLSGRPLGLDPMEKHRANFQPKSYQFELGVDIVMMEHDSMWRLGYLHNRVGPTRFVPIRQGVSLQQGQARMEHASFKPGGPVARASKSGAPAPCPYDWVGFNYVDCTEIYGSPDCVYQALNVNPNGWYNYAGTELTYCFHLWGGALCSPSDYYPPFYAYCGI